MPKQNKSSTSSISKSSSLSTSKKDQSSPKPGSERHVSCEGCRRRKMKCSRTYPCQSCILRNEKCIWSGKNAPAESLDSTLNELTSAQEQTRQLRKIQDILLRRIIELEKEKGLPSIENDSLALEEMLTRLNENNNSVNKKEGFSKRSSSSASSLGDIKEYKPFSHSDSSTTSSFVQSPLNLSPTFGPPPTHSSYFDLSTQRTHSDVPSTSSQLIYRPHSIPDFKNSFGSNGHSLDVYPLNAAIEARRQLDISTVSVDNHSNHYTTAALPLPTSSFPSFPSSQILSNLPQVPYYNPSQSHNISLPHSQTFQQQAQDSSSAISYSSSQAGSFAGRYDYALSLRSKSTSGTDANRSLNEGDIVKKSEEGIEKHW